MASRIPTALACFLVLAAVAQASIGWNECNTTFIDFNAPPSVPNKTARVCREGYIAIAYDIDMKVPAWSSYFITPADVHDIIPGRNSFYEDPDLQAMGVAQAAVKSHAFNNSFNRGHLAPSHIMSANKVSKRSCYTMANIAPQAAIFNQQPWAALENNVFNWISSNKSLHLITGVAFVDRSHPSWTYDSIAVPTFYWKVICDITTGQSAGFYGHNDDSHREEAGIYRTVAEVEQVYGGKLFPSNLCNKDQVNPSYWWG